eukprot:Polyplicarium_translucidae@DN608_c0_g1_i1.p1
MICLYRAQPEFVYRAAEVCSAPPPQGVSPQVFRLIVDGLAHPVLLDFAFRGASQRFNFPPWLQIKIENGGLEALAIIMEWLKGLLLRQSEDDDIMSIPERRNLLRDSFKAIEISAYRCQLSEGFKRELKHIEVYLNRALVEGKMPGVGNKERASKMDLDTEVYVLFSQLYKDESFLPQFLARVKRLSFAPNGSRDADLFATTLKIIFAECRFFPQYPEQQLVTSAKLFGQMVRHRVLVGRGNAEILMMRCIVEALTKHQGPSMALFGIVALEQFFDTISQCPC